LQLLIVEDSEFIIRNNFHTTIDRISESLTKCQHLVFNDKKDGSIDKLRPLFMKRAQFVEVK